MDAFVPYFGSAPPALVLAVALLVGAGCLWFMLPRDGFVALSRDEVVRGSALAAGAASFFGVIIVLIDLAGPLPADINVALPQALWFYPIVGLVAEVAFHLVPLSLLLLVSRVVAGGVPAERRVSASLVVVALVEPAFQVVFTTTTSAVISALVALHVLGISAAQLAIFRRFDFVSMYVMRLVYYLWWHVVWGTLRLDLLF